MSEKFCQFIKTDGEKCEAWAMTNNDFCFSHNPEMDEAKKESVIRGGQSPKKNFNPLPPVKVKDSKDVVKLVSQVINEVRQGIIDIRVANCLFYGSGMLIKALEIADLEDRVGKLEETLNKRDIGV
ncbi:MAG: hypothetical protein AAB584_02350 [Patescibacteria group bacterium]